MRRFNCRFTLIYCLPIRVRLITHEVRKVKVKDCVHRTELGIELNLAAGATYL